MDMNESIHPGRINVVGVLSLAEFALAGVFTMVSFLGRLGRPSIGNTMTAADVRT